MSFTQSPNSGDTGLNLPGRQAVRLMAFQLAPLEAIMVDRSQLPETPLDDWGFEGMATRDPKFQLPELGLVADLSSRFDVDFLNRDDGIRVGGFAFGDPHPDPWWDAVHQNRRLLIFVADVSAYLRATDLAQQIQVIQRSHIGLAPLAIRAYPDGVGTAAPGQ